MRIKRDVARMCYSNKIGQNCKTCTHLKSDKVDFCHLKKINMNVMHPVIPLSEAVCGYWKKGNKL